MNAATFFVPATFELVMPDDAANAGVDAAIKHATGKQKARGAEAPKVVALFDLDLDGTNEIIVRDSALFAIYDSTGKPLAGSVGCYVSR